MNSNINPESLNRIAEQTVPDSLDLWPQIRARIQAAPTRRPTTFVDPRSASSLTIGVTAAILLALVLAATFVIWNAPEAVSAESILDRAQMSADTTVAAVQTYHLEMLQRVPSKGNLTIDTEIWFGGNERQRQVERVKDASGTTVSVSEVVINGAQVWIATTEGGKTKVVHTTGTAWNDVADNPSRRASLTDVLSQYNNKPCTNAELQGEARVAGQAAYVIAVTPKPGACAPKAAIETRTAVLRGSKPSAPPNQPWQMLVWVDKSTFVPLKTEVRDASGLLEHQSEVKSIEYNITIPGSNFSYSSPAGASIFEFTGGTGADVKAALCAKDPSLGCQSQSSKPIKKP